MELVKEKINTLSRWGDFPEKRDLETALSRSMIILDKPKGPTSHQVSSWVQKRFDMKAGHSGTLDPNASGVLPMGLGTSVRVMDLLHRAPKEYIVAMKFHGDVRMKDVEGLVEEYTGEIYQVPPVRSGVKRERRIREIYNMEILDSEGSDYLLKVRCESGTYMRTLCSDMGKSIANGGHMMELRRTEAGGFDETWCVTLQDLRDAWEFYQEGEPEELEELSIPYERALELYPKVKVKDSAAGALLNGADLAAPGVLELDDFKIDDTVAIVSVKGEGIAIGEALKGAEEISNMEEGLVVRTERVFHPSGTYPRTWK